MAESSSRLNRFGQARPPASIAAGGRPGLRALWRRRSGAGSAGAPAGWRGAPGGSLLHLVIVLAVVVVVRDFALEVPAVHNDSNVPVEAFLVPDRFRELFRR